MRKHKYTTHLIFTVCLCFSFVPKSTAATDTLPERALLFAALDTFHRKQLAAELAEFDLSDRGAWMNYVPSVGVGYTPVASVASGAFQSQPRPVISYSLGQVFNARKQKEVRAAKRRSLTASAELRLQSARRKLQRLLTDYDLLRSDYQQKTQLFALDEELFAYYEKSYRNLELLPTQFLLKKREFIAKKYDLRKTATVIGNKESEILETSCYLRPTSNLE